MILLSRGRQRAASRAFVRSGLAAVLQVVVVKWKRSTAGHSSDCDTVIVLRLFLACMPCGTGPTSFIPPDCGEPEAPVDLGC